MIRSTRSFARTGLAALLSLAAADVLAQGTAPSGIDYANAAFSIDGQRLQLAGGQRAAPAVPGSAAERHTRVVGTPAFGTLAGLPAAAVFVADDGGGSGQFFYVGVAFGNGHATVPAPIGDRIQPRSIVFRGDRLVATFLDRRPGEPMASAPTVPKTVVLAFDAARDALVETRDAGVTPGADKRGD
ncbi:hypothetical protein C0Z17_24095 [Trinickia caryophylli]|nr:hypothetical protein C0Z17_24095 [Trinickia caryophylli]